MKSLFLKKMPIIFDYISFTFYFCLGCFIIFNHPFLAMQLDYFFFFSPYIVQSFINFINFWVYLYIEFIIKFFILLYDFFSVIF
jgi:hypothetical protein